mgnify:CR=1 FL=1
MTIEQLRAQIETWETAALKVSKGKSYTVDGLTYTRQDLSAIQGRLDALYARLACLLRGGSCHRASPVRPIDHIHTHWMW